MAPRSNRTRVEHVPRERSEVPPREVGVESAHGFGDCLFNIPLIRELKILHNTKIGVAVRPHCKDAFINVPWVSEVIECSDMWHGLKALQKLGYNRRFQITQNAKFFDFRTEHLDHSLIHTPLWTGRELGCPKDFDNKPLFFPTASESMAGMWMKKDGKPTIAIESVYTSDQSWANKKAFDMIVAKYAPTHRILWLSNAGAPDIPAVDNMLRFSRRECIMCLQACDIFFSVGSGFFCASLALDPTKQPKKIVCLWTDGFYRYEKPLSEYKWHPDITWIHNHNELNQCLNSQQS